MDPNETKQEQGSQSRSQPILHTQVDGLRMKAAAVDLILIFFLLSLTNQGGFILFNFTSSGYSVATGPAVALYGMKGLITVIIITLYFVLMEYWKGGTVGKLAAGIKVTKEDGSRIGFGSSVIRNLLRIVDGFPYFVPYFVGLIFMVTSSKRQRLGDKLAKTIVVKS